MGRKHGALGAALMTSGLITTALLGAPPAAQARGLPVPWRVEGNGAIGGDRLSGHGIIAPDGVPAPPKTEASAFVVADADTGAVLAAKDPHGHYAPASTLKTLTAVTLIPRLDKDLKVKPSEKACNVEGSAVGIVPEPIYKVDDLMRALLMVSGNDAAVALAEANGGMRRTIDDMNEEARSLQAYDTVAKTPHGLDEPGQRSSAYDLALIARAGLKLPAFREYISTKVAKFPAPKDYGKKKKKADRDGQDDDGQSRDDGDSPTPTKSPPAYYEMANHNKLLGTYKGMLGVKNGWTSKALGSFVGAARRDGHTIIVVVMHHPGGFWEEVAHLLDWGFAVRGKAAPVGQLVGPAPSPTPSSSVLAARPATSVSPSPAAAAGKQGAAPRVATLVLGAGLAGGLAVVGYGVVRRRRRADA
ncbi:D-alanyl-D-alanine carboxypeptidase [Microbispora sp. ATCC PTA-5024]|nr:D-alanyl-D-alanine carboxypeptidase [Microbispora sp. ATCC PTA-5024]